MCICAIFLFDFLVHLPTFENELAGMQTKLFEYFLSAAQDTINDIASLTENSLLWIQRHIQLAMAEINATWQSSKSYFINLWEINKPKVDKLSQATTVAITTTSTFMTAIDMMPVIFSALPILAGIPLIGLILPEFFLTNAVLATMMVGVSAFVGYLKHLELQERAMLDHTIADNQCRIKSVETELKQLKSQQQGKIKSLKAKLRQLQSHHQHCKKSNTNLPRKPKQNLTPGFDLSKKRTSPRTNNIITPPSTAQTKQSKNRAIH